MERGAWQATVHKVTRVRHDLVTPPNQTMALHATAFAFAGRLDSVKALYHLVSPCTYILISIDFPLTILTF